LTEPLLPLQEIFSNVWSLFGLGREVQLTSSG
jgi:hypothetical protein